jgi:DNA-binding GntR family transcriptional regulator
MTRDRKLTRNTLQSQLAETLITTLNEGTYQPGDLFTTETELIEKYGVSRNTVRIALQTLKDMGLLVSIQGKGAFVASPPAPPVIQERTGADPWQTLTPVGESHDERAAADPETAALLGIPHRDLIFIRHQAATSTATGQPVLTTRIIPSVVLEKSRPKLHHDAERPDLITTWTKQYGALHTAYYVRAVIPAGDKWTALGITQPTPAQETIMLTETADGHPLMIEMELTAASVRDYFPTHPVPSAIGARD